MFCLNTGMVIGCIFVCINQWIINLRWKKIIAQKNQLLYESGKIIGNQAKLIDLLRKPGTDTVVVDLRRSEPMPN